jgi:hypothetical protein
MMLSSVTKEWFEYSKLEAEQPEGIDRLVLPPQMAFSNIRNGYGMVYGVNTIEVILAQ